MRVTLESGTEAAANRDNRSEVDQELQRVLRTWAARQLLPDQWDHIRAGAAAEQPAQTEKEFKRGNLRRQMMSHNFIGLGEVWAGQEHYQDLLREAEQSRLVAGLPHRSASRRALAWVGRELVALGSRISARYEDASREWAAGSDWMGDCQPALGVQARIRHTS